MWFLYFVTDSFLLAKSLMLSGKFWVISTDPEQPSSMAIKHIIKRSYNKYGVFLDYDCSNGQDCIFQVSSRVCQSGHSFVKATLETDTLVCFSRMKVVCLGKQTWMWIKSITHNETVKTLHIALKQSKTGPQYGDAKHPTVAEYFYYICLSDRENAGFSCRQFRTVRLKFHCQLHFGEPLDTDSFKRNKG